MAKAMSERSSAPPPLRRSSALLSRLFLALVVRPIRLANGALGERLWPALERPAAALGAVAALGARRWLEARPGEHPLAPLVRFTDLIEGGLGIRGTNEFPRENQATRVVSHCPFASELRHSAGFCTSLGFVAGKAACERLVPGSTFEIVQTMSQGHPCCEYRYRR